MHCDDDGLKLMKEQYNRLSYDRFTNVFMITSIEQRYMLGLTCKMHTSISINTDSAIHPYQYAYKFSN